MIRVQTSGGRGITTQLWGNLVDRIRGSFAPEIGVVAEFDDFTPYNAGSLTLSGDSGAAATPSAVPNGVVAFTASAGTYAVAGYARNAYVDLDSSKDVCREVRFGRTAGGTGSEITFIGFSDQAPEAVFHSDGTLDGGSGEDGFGLRWNNDLTVDLVSIINSTATVLQTGIFSAVSNSDVHTFGIRLIKQSSTAFNVLCSVDDVVKSYAVLASALTTAAVRPVAVTTISATDAPTITVDWDAWLDKNSSTAIA